MNIIMDNDNLTYFAQLENVLDHISNVNSLSKVGIQGPPSMLMCINGEQIRLGKTGIYEINNGVKVNFIAFVPKLSLNGLDYFIMDFEYQQQEV